jgi:urea transport system permease protein
MQSWLTTSYPDFWLLFLGALFMGVVLFIPDGVVGFAGRVAARVSVRRARPEGHAAFPPAVSTDLAAPATKVPAAKP